MTDKKISQLSAATTPLAGTEVLPIVQSSTTVKVASDDLTVKNVRSNATTGILQISGPAAASTRTMTVPDANFTAARTDAANSFTGDQTLATGNVIIGTSGKGIDFSATPGTGTSELLDDYEEGTFTPTIVGTTAAGAGTYTEQNGYYTKIGNRVLVNIALAWSAHTGTGNMRISGLPFSNENVTDNISVPSFYVGNIALTAGNYLQGVVLPNSTQILLYEVPTGGGSSAFVPLDTDAILRVSLQYQTAS